jgi:MFS family permease
MGGSRTGFGPYLGTTALISLGFFTMGLMDPLYDNFVPLFLGQYIHSRSLIGAIMTIDNVFAILLIPLVSVWSDRTRTRIGRRMPFIVLALPASALLFAALPSAALVSGLALVGLIVVLNVFKQGARGPVVALMPDIIPGKFRSEANGVINMSSAVAAIIGTLFLARLMDLDMVLPILGATKHRLPFLIAAFLVLVTVLMLFLLVKERGSGQASPGAGEDPGEGQGGAQPGVLRSLGLVIASKDRSALYILIAIFLWFFGYQGVLPFISGYMRDVMGVSYGQTAMASGAVAVAMTVCAVPSGYIAHRVGRKRTIRFALAALAVVLAATFAHEPLCAALGLSRAARLASFLGLMFLFGAFWIAVVANSFPMLWQMASFSNIGVYTGVYYASKEFSSILSPPATGAIADMLGLRWMFAVASLFMLAAFFVMRGVSSGEAPKEA